MKTNRFGDDSVAAGSPTWHQRSSALCLSRRSRRSGSPPFLQKNQSPVANNQWPLGTITTWNCFRNQKPPKTSKNHLCLHPQSTSAELRHPTLPAASIPPRGSAPCRARDPSRAPGPEASPSTAPATDEAPGRPATAFGPLIFWGMDLFQDLQQKVGGSHTRNLGSLNGFYKTTDQKNQLLKPKLAPCSWLPADT